MPEVKKCICKKCWTKRQKTPKSPYTVILCAYTHTHTHRHMHTNAYMDTHTHALVDMHTYGYTNAHAETHMRIGLHKCTHAHTRQSSLKPEGVIFFISVE